MVLSGLNGPLKLGKEITVFDREASAAGSDVEEFGIDSDSITVSVFVRSVSGTVDIKVETVGDSDPGTTELKEIMTFPTISSGSTELVIKQSSVSLSTVRITATYSDACDFRVNARATGPVSSFGDSVLNTLGPKSTPSIQNVSIASANTEQSLSLPANTVAFRLRAKGDAKLTVAYVSAGNTWTVWPGSYYLEEDLGNISNTLYIESSKAGEIVELVSWTS